MTRTIRTCTFCETVAILWRTMRRDFSDPYRPERHYMRGPGPRWREKHVVKPIAVRGTGLGLTEAPV